MIKEKSTIILDIKTSLIAAGDSLKSCFGSFIIYHKLQMNTCHDPCMNILVLGFTIYRFCKKHFKESCKRHNCITVTGGDNLLHQKQIRAGLLS